MRSMRCTAAASLGLKATLGRREHHLPIALHAQHALRRLPPPVAAQRLHQLILPQAHINIRSVKGFMRSMRCAACRRPSLRSACTSSSCRRRTYT